MLYTTSLLWLSGFVLQQALAQTSQCWSPSDRGSTTTISTPSQASAIASACPTYGGGITIDPNTTQDLVFPGLQSIRGDLHFANMQTDAQYHFPDLQSVNSTLGLIGRTTYISFDSLTAVDGLTLQDYYYTPSSSDEPTIPNLLAGGKLSTMTGVYIKNASSLTSMNLPGWQPSAVAHAITHCYNLTTLKISGAYTRDIEILDSGIPTLDTPFNVDLSQVSIVTNVIAQDNFAINLSSTINLKDGIIFTNNSGTKHLDLNQLTGLNGSVLIDSNKDLTELSMSRLASVQTDVKITNNPQLQSTGNFTSLKYIRGSLALAGPISNLSSMNDLSLVGGAFTIDSTTAFPCTDVYKQLQASNTLQNGTFGCKSTSDSSGQTNLVNDPNSSTSSKGLSGGAIAGIVIGVIAVIALVALLVWWLRRRRRTRFPPRYSQAANGEHPMDEHSAVWAKTSNSHEPNELDNTQKPVPELYTDDKPAELNTESAPRELAGDGLAGGVANGFAKDRKSVPTMRHELPADYQHSAKDNVYYQHAR